MNARLQLEEQILEFQDDKITIGRDSDLFKICDYSVSRQHFTLCREKNGDAYRIYDLKSLSGTWVDGVQVPAQGLLLPDFAQIRCGNSVFSYYFLGNLEWDDTTTASTRLDLNMDQISDVSGPLMEFLYRMATFLQEKSWSSDRVKTEILQLICRYLVIDVAILVAVPDNHVYKSKITARSSIKVSLSNIQIPRQMLDDCITQHLGIRGKKDHRKMLCLPILLQPVEYVLYLERGQEKDFSKNEIICLAAAIRLIVLNDQMQRLIERAIQAQKLETIGMTASGIVHSFNNLLSCFSSSIELLTTQLESNQITVGKECLENLRQTCQDATTLTAGLMNFIKGRKVPQISLNLSNLLENLYKIFRPSLPSNIQFELNLHQPNIAIAGNAAELSQAMLNVLCNAKEAMPNGGKLIIATSFIDHPACLLESSSTYVEIEISDTGIGMDATILKKIFTPFFTTKALEGNGLGLCYTLSVVQQHGGKIDVKSVPDEGSHFYIYLPLTADKTSPSTRLQFR